MEALGKDIDIVLIGLVVIIAALFGAFFFFLRELRLRSTSPGHSQSDLTNMMILFQTMRDILAQQKDLAREFNISIDKKVGEVRSLIDSTGNVRAELKQAKRDIARLSAQTKKELASLERRLMQVDSGAALEAAPALEEADESADEVESLEDDDESAPEVEEAPEESTTVLEELDPVGTPPNEVGAVKEEFLSKWGGTDFGSDDESEEEDPDLEEDPQDAIQTRDALRDLLNFQKEPNGNGGSTTSSEVLNSGANGGKFLTPIQKRVYEYSDTGMRVPEIARELGVGKGEIRLILSLRRDRAR